MGADANAGSPELLAAVPGLSAKVAATLVAARPHRSRAALRERVKGLGPVAFANAAGFIQVMLTENATEGESK